MRRFWAIPGCLSSFSGPISMPALLREQNIVVCTYTSLFATNIAYIALPLLLSNSTGVCCVVPSDRQTEGDNNIYFALDNCSSSLDRCFRVVETPYQVYTERVQNWYCFFRALLEKTNQKGVPSTVYRRVKRGIVDTSTKITTCT